MTAANDLFDFIPEFRILKWDNENKLRAYRYRETSNLLNSAVLGSLYLQLSTVKYYVSVVSVSKNIISLQIYVYFFYMLLTVLKESTTQKI